MTDYTKYSDKSIRNKKLEDMNQEERDLVSVLTEREANNFLARFRAEPRYMERIATEIAKQTLTKEEKNNDEE